MTLKLKFEIDSGANGFSIERKEKTDTSSPDYQVGILKINIHRGYLYVLKSGGTDGDVIQSNTNTIVDAGGSNVKLQDMTEIWIEAPFSQINLTAKKICLRAGLKGTAQANTDKGKTVVVLENLKIADNSLTFPIADLETIIKFEASYFTQSLSDSLKINIGTDGGLNAVKAADFNGTVQDLSPYENALIKITRIIEDINNYNINFRTKTAPEIQQDIEKLEEILKKGVATADSPEKAVFNLNHVRGVDEQGDDQNFGFFYKESIIGGKKTSGTFEQYTTGRLPLLSELKIWKETGVNTFEEIAKANANGYTIFNRGSNDSPQTDVTIGNGRIVEIKPDGSGKNDGVIDNLKKVRKMLKNYYVYGIMVGTDQTAPIPETDLNFPNNASKIVLDSLAYPASAGGDANGIKYSKTQIDEFLGSDWFGKKQGDSYDYGADSFIAANLTDNQLNITRGIRLEDFDENGRYFNGHGENLSDLFELYDPSSNGLSATKTTPPLNYV